MRVGDIELVPLSDGTCKMPQEFYVGLDFATHQELLAEDGLVHIPVGCFLLRTGGTTVLSMQDSGTSTSDGAGGELPAALRAAGASPEDIDAVVCSHLHIDHIGWLVVDGAPYFPNATCATASPTGRSSSPGPAPLTGAGKSWRFSRPPVGSILSRATCFPSLPG